MSFTTFRYSNLRLTKSRLSAAEKLTVTINIENTGSRDGAEIVQLYTHDVTASVTRPVRELKGFERVELRSGEKKTVTIVLDPCDLGFYNREMKFVVEPGLFKLWVGESSVGGLESEFEIL
jgi:beta-glucosidase